MHIGNIPDCCFLRQLLFTVCRKFCYSLLLFNDFQPTLRRFKSSHLDTGQCFIELLSHRSHSAVSYTHLLLVRFTKALYKAMDFGANEENYEEVAGYVADETKTDVETAMGQTTCLLYTSRCV